MAKAPTAKRYAEALFELARARQAEDAWAEALSGARDVLSEPTAVLYFSEPRISRERKLEAVALLAEGYDRLIVNFLGLLVARQATSLLPDIVSAYGALLNESAGRIQASVVGPSARVLFWARLGSLNALETLACAPFWKKWLGRKVPRADTIGRV